MYIFIEFQAFDLQWFLNSFSLFKPKTNIFSKVEASIMAVIDATST